MSTVRGISSVVERLLWGIAAGRCEFEGCNKVLYKHSVTGATENYAQKAHIYAVMPGGARYCPGDSSFKNNVDNLMLVCPQCHITIDRNEEKYTPELLYDMKRKHEERVFRLTGIGAEMQSHMVYYTASISGTSVAVNDDDARNALVAYGRYPSEISPINLSQQGSRIQDNEAVYFSSNVENLYRAVQSRILDIIAEGQSIALFALAPQPLLIYLGYLLNDKYNVAVFQCHRREHDKWKWADSVDQVIFRLECPADPTSTSKIALLFSLSSSIKRERISAVLGNDVSLYTVTLDSPNRSFVKNPSIMDDFVEKSREVLEIIKQKHGKAADIHVFPAMPVSLAVRFGMDYMEKSDNRLLIYDEQPEKGFVFALALGGRDE